MVSDANAITSEMNVEDVITRFPPTVRVFVRRRLHCVGCDLARFETLADVSRIYRQPLPDLLAEIRSSVGQAN